MTYTIRNLSRIYAFLLCFYPRCFRREFAPEIVDTFTSALQEAWQESRKEFVSTFLRELRDYFPNLFNAYLAEGGIVMDEIFAKKNPMRSVQAGAAGFGLGFMLMGLATGLLRMAPGGPGLMTQFFVDLILSSILIGAIGGAALGYSLDPRRTKQCAILCAAGYLLGSLLIYIVDISGKTMAQPLWVVAILVYAAPCINGALIGLCISWNADLKKHTSIFILSGIVSFEIGWCFNRLSLVAMNTIANTLGFPFPPNSDVIFILTWLISSAVYGIVAGGLLGAVVGIFAKGEIRKANAIAVSE